MHTFPAAPPNRESIHPDWVDKLMAPVCAKHRVAGVGRRAGGGRWWLVVCGLWFFFFNFQKWVSKSSATRPQPPPPATRTQQDGSPVPCLWRAIPPKSRTHSSKISVIFFFLTLLQLPSPPAALLGGENNNKNHTIPTPACRLHLTVSSCRTGVVAGRAGWGIWGGCSARDARGIWRRRRESAADARTSSPRRHI